MLSREQIEQKIRAILTQDFKVPEAAIVPAATFRGSFKLDSLDVVDFVLLLQKDFGFKAPIESYRELASYENLCGFVERTLREREG